MDGNVIDGMAFILFPSIPYMVSSLFGEPLCGSAKFGDFVCGKKGLEGFGGLRSARKPMLMLVQACPFQSTLSLSLPLCFSVSLLDFFIYTYISIYLSVYLSISLSPPPSLSLAPSVAL